MFVKSLGLLIISSCSNLREADDILVPW